jgi:hypothetical protein
MEDIDVVILDEISRIRNNEENRRLQLELPIEDLYYKKEKEDYKEEPKRVIIIEL